MEHVLYSKHFLNIFATRSLFPFSFRSMKSDSSSPTMTTLLLKNRPVLVCTYVNSRIASPISFSINPSIFLTVYGTHVTFVSSTAREIQSGVLSMFQYREYEFISKILTFLFTVRSCQCFIKYSGFSYLHAIYRDSILHPLIFSTIEPSRYVNLLTTSVQSV